jgi:hypothetical protein
VPDATTLLKFRRLLEENKLGEALIAKVGEILQSRGLKLGRLVRSTAAGAFDRISPCCEAYELSPQTCSSRPCKRSGSGCLSCTLAAVTTALCARPVLLSTPTASSPK